ncbi:MAG: hypothetical protein KBT28_12505 [Bacteroidales bacterium]|nr:hypothetical protein [Candidatus Colimorpha merdihippi]
MAVIDSVLFRMWQMHWLPGCERAEHTCKVEWKHIGGDVAAGYCECGIELDRCHDYEPAHLPNFCPECGRKVVD